MATAKQDGPSPEEVRLKAEAAGSGGWWAAKHADVYCSSVGGGCAGLLIFVETCLKPNQGQEGSCTTAEARCGL